MDLVDAAYGVSLLKNEAYPLQLGYVGLINASNQSIFTQSPYDASLQTGHAVLKRLLLTTLTQRTRESLNGCITSLQTSLNEARYCFKVKYNDEPITGEVYISRIVDNLKTQVNAWLKSYTKAVMREEFAKVFYSLSQEIVEDVYLKRVSDADGAVDYAKLDELMLSRDDSLLAESASRMTKAGVGKITTLHVSERISAALDAFLNSPTFTAHPTLQQTLHAFSTTLITHYIPTTQTQVENTIKPYKFELEITKEEYRQATADTLARLSRQKHLLMEHYYSVRGSVGRRKYRSTVSLLQTIEKEKKAILGNTVEGDLMIDVIPLSVLEQVSSAQKSLHRANLVAHRIATLTSSASTRAGPTAQPEIYLTALGTKLASTAALFIEVEFLRSVGSGFGGIDSAWRGKVREMCGEGVIGEWIAVQRRISGIEEILREIDSLGNV